MFYTSRNLLTLIFCSCLLSLPAAYASGTGQIGDYKDIKKIPVDSTDERKKIETTAVLLANYEIDSKKLLGSLDDGKRMAADIRNRAEQLLVMSETIIDSARFRLPQCDEYLSKSMALKQKLGDISLAQLETDYHHDGALPAAPPECYHTKDLFVHPATVIVLTRDDPALRAGTITAIRAEIEEVLAHTDVVRQLVIY